MMIEIPYELLGRLIVVILIIVAILMLIGISLGYLMIKNGRIFLPKMMVLLWDFIYLPLRRISNKLDFNEAIIGEINVELRNLAYANEFKQIQSKDKILFLPQCLRSINCVASLSSKDGIICKKCGACHIPKITKEANSLGYKKVYIAPGGSFVKRIIEEEKPKAIFAVGCFYELSLGGLLISQLGIVGKAIPLLRDGCVCTEVDVDRVINAMRISNMDMGE
jgi:hypothetical protein